MPKKWQAAVARWAQMNSAKKSPFEKGFAPSANDEYLLYQTLVGAWPATPLTAETMPAFRERIVQYMQKATKEAKVHTSWVNANEEYDAAVKRFVERLLPDNLHDDFLTDLTEFQAMVGYFGYFNALAQTLLKLTVPGVPDIYQGTELWDFSLVDPDNRRPVDYGHRRTLLNGLKSHIAQLDKNLAPLAEELLANLPDGRAKLYLIYRTLTFRRANRELFAHGVYIPLSTAGEKAQHLVCFLRPTEEQSILVAAPRLVAGLTSGNQQPPVGAEVWKDTRVVFPRGAARLTYQCLFTGQTVTAAEHDGAFSMPAAELFASFPVFLGVAVRGT
jgi:(1->4)-alpha-D-glucan 1-alpha-D-glucosylmutase